MRKFKKSDALFVTLFLIVLSFLLFKSQYGYIYNDEPFLLELGLRFVKGGKPFIDEWSLQQMTGFMIYPFMLLFSLIKNDNNWIVLYGRFCFIFLWSITNLYAYIKLKKHGIYAVFGCISIYLFAPLDMMTLSYNSFFLVGIVLICVMIYTAKSKNNYFVIGIISCICILSIPYMIFVYFFFTIISFMSLSNKKIKLPNNISFFDGWINFTLGALTIFLLFCIVIFKNSTFDHFIKSIENMLHIDKEHKFLNPIMLVVTYFVEINLKFKFLIFSFSLFCIITLFDAHRYKRKNIYLIFVLIQYFYVVYSLINSLDIYPNLNLVFLPISFLGFEIFIITRKKNYEIFYTFMIFGVILSFIFHLSSNLGLPAIGTTYTIVGLGTFLSFENLDIKSKKEKILLVIVCITQLIFQFYHRYNYYYLDEKIDKLKVRLSDGPAKGIYTNINDAEQYMYLLDQIKYLTGSLNNTDNLLILDFNPWLYLVSDARYGTYSTWGTWGNIDLFWEFNKKYYNLNPNNFPTHIIVSKKYVENLSECINFFKENNYHIFESYDYIMYYK